MAEVEEAPRAFVEGHCPGEPRGRSAVNRTQSRRGNAGSALSFEGWRAAAEVKVLQGRKEGRQAVELTTKGGGRTDRMVEEWDAQG